MKQKSIARKGKANLFLILAMFTIGIFLINYASSGYYGKFIFFHNEQAIIMNTYDMLRQRKQLVTEAMAGIMASETRKQKAIWMNLLFFRLSSQ